MTDCRARAVKALFGDKEDGPWNNEQAWGERDGYAISVPALTRALQQAVVATLSVPLSSAEQRLIDKHCDWVAFGHAWNAVMKRRREAVESPQIVIDK